jgi:ABC-type cobalamin/Fe3+-siderophores transport system ATPase subunit
MGKALVNMIVVGDKGCGKSSLLKYIRDSKTANFSLVLRDGLLNLDVKN